MLDVTAAEQLNTIDRGAGEGEKKELTWEINPSTLNTKSTSHSGDDEVLDFLQSKTIVGIQDCYPFWRDNNHAPWAGKPVWARTSSSGLQHHHYHNHHHILLDDNIHNDPNDGAGGIRTPIQSSKTSYDSLHGTEALDMHGKHLIRVPTIRPLLEDDWFVRQIESARWKLHEEDNRGGTREREEDKQLYLSLKEATNELVLSNRNLSENDFHRDLQWPAALIRIDLSRNSFNHLPQHIFSYSMLTHLDVSRNSLQGLPPEIRQLANLVELIALSNHLRLRQLPFDELASLAHLKLLDLRYNRKLKEAAQKTLEDALNNPQLEIRCTIPSHNADKTKKLSACDRDAALLQSQLEPLSTPQLCKRLERSFGVTLDRETEQAYDRDYVMKTVLQCYDKHGPREIRKEDGIPVKPLRIAALLKELEAIHWPQTTRERPKIRAERYMILQKPGSGEPDSARTKKETAKLMKYKKLFDLAVETLAEVDPEFAERFTALAVTKCFVGSPHIDTLNVGPFYGISLGEFTGGGKIAVECSPFLVAEVDTHGRYGKVDGRFPHWVTSYTGCRYSLIYYVTSGKVEPQTTAIFAPPNANNNNSSPWIPPPTFVP